MTDLIVGAPVEIGTPANPVTEITAQFTLDDTFAVEVALEARPAEDSVIRSITITSISPWSLAVSAELLSGLPATARGEIEDNGGLDRDLATAVHYQRHPGRPRNRDETHLDFAIALDLAARQHAGGDPIGQLKGRYRGMPRRTLVRWAKASVERGLLTPSPDYRLTQKARDRDTRRHWRDP